MSGPLGGAVLPRNYSSKEEKSEKRLSGTVEVSQGRFAFIKTGSDHRSLSSEQLREKEEQTENKKHKKSHKVASEKMYKGHSETSSKKHKTHRKYKKKVSPPEPETVSSNSSSTTSHEKPRQMVLPNKLPSEVQPTVMQRLMNDDLARFEECYKKVIPLVKNFFQNKAVTEREAIERSALMSDLQTSVLQLFYDLQTGLVNGFDFFSPDERRRFPNANFKKINQYLNQKIVLFEREELNKSTSITNKENLGKILELQNLEENQKKQISQTWLKLPAAESNKKAAYETAQLQFNLLSDYVKSIKFLCDKIKNQDIFKNHFNNLKLKINNKDCDHKKIAEEIEATFQEIATQNKVKVGSIELPIKQLGPEDLSALNSCAKLYFKKMNKHFSPIDININSQNNEFNFQAIEKIIEQLGKLTEGHSELFKSNLIDTISLRYLANSLRPILIEKAREIVKNFSLHDTKAFFDYKDVVAEWETKFNTLDMVDPLPEWERAIYAGFVVFVDWMNKVVLGPFEDPGADKLEEREAALNKYVTDCQETVGKYLFDDSEIIKELCRLIEVEAGGRLPGETLLNSQKRIMGHLGALQQDTKAMGIFFASISEKLKKWNEERGELKNSNIDKYPVHVMLMYLMMFYRAPSQKFLWGPTGVLRDAFKLIFPEDGDIFQKLAEWEDNETKLIYIQFNEHDLSLKFVRKGIISTNDNDGSHYIFTQELTVKVPKPGGSVDEPVSVQFYYEVPEGLSDEATVKLEEIKEKLDFVLKVLDFPALKKIRSMKPNEAPKEARAR